MMPDFQEEVLEATSEIPEGRVTTYKKLAEAVGKPKSYRGVGNILAHNPRYEKVPCHRVVKSNGDIGGFIEGQEKKEALLREEGVEIKNGKVNLEKHLFKFDS